MGSCTGANRKKQKSKAQAQSNSSSSDDESQSCAEAKPPRLLSLQVERAVQVDATHFWEAVNGVEQIRVIAVTDPPNTVPAWTPDTLAAGENGNVKLVSRAAIGTITVTATLDIAPNVEIKIYDLTDMTSTLPANGVGGHRWKAYVSANTTVLTAVTVPNTNEVWPKVVWTEGIPRNPVNAQAVALTPVGDATITASLGTIAPKTVSGVLHICQWPVLAVDEITFSGGHTVNNDTAADFDNKWTQVRAQANLGNPQLDPSPLCYTRNTPVTLTATLRVTTQPTDPENVTVRGTAVIGLTTIVWTSAPITVNPGPATVPFVVPVPGSLALPNQVAAYNPLTITWEMSGPTGNWIGIGSTQHRIYVTLGNPAGTPAYWTLLHYSCTGAAGAANDQALITGAFNPLRGLNLTRQRDNVPLTYWNPQGPARGNSNTALLLAEPTGAGHCGSWALFFIDMLKAHGVGTGHKVNVTRPAVVQQIGPVVVGAGVKRGFLVATWNFAPVPATSPADLTHTRRGNCNPGVYAPGQNNPQPPPAFYNHFVVHCTTDGRIYDPSYGHDFANPDAWEPASISGLYSDCAAPNAGYSPVGAARLLQFRDLVTNGNL
jgi:hypothetical protein